MDQQEQQRFIEATLQDWSKLVLSRLAGQIQARKVVLTEELMRSLQAEVLRASADQVAQMKLAFSAHGRLRDMKAIHHKNLPPIEEMEEFVRKVGLSKFKYVPGYQNGRVPTENQAVNRIAWGIARARLQQNKTKPKKWFAKPFYGTINVLIDKLLTGYAEYAAQSITQNLNPGNGNS